jgi:hypothetical protein
MELTVEMYGLSPYTEANSVKVEVKNDAGIQDVLGAVIQKIPSLEGHVIQSGVNRLVETYGMYLNGRFINQDESIEIKPDDRIVLILLAVGG